MYVKAKKALGQHFLKDREIAAQIVEALQLPETTEAKTNVLEVGPGTGVLTQFLTQKPQINL